jgi:hypothetical protein
LPPRTALPIERCAGESRWSRRAGPWAPGVDVSTADPFSSPRDLATLAPTPTGSTLSLALGGGDRGEATAGTITQSPKCRAIDCLERSTNTPRWSSAISRMRAPALSPGRLAPSKTALWSCEFILLRVDLDPGDSRCASCARLQTTGFIHSRVPEPNRAGCPASRLPPSITSPCSLPASP